MRNLLAESTDCFIYQSRPVTDLGFRIIVGFGYERRRPLPKTLDRYVTGQSALDDQPCGLYRSRTYISGLIFRTLAERKDHIPRCFTRHSQGKPLFGQTISKAQWSTALPREPYWPVPVSDFIALELHTAFSCCWKADDRARTGIHSSKKDFIPCHSGTHLHIPDYAHIYPVPTNP